MWFCEVGLIHCVDLGFSPGCLVKRESESLWRWQWQSEQVWSSWNIWSTLYHPEKHFFHVSYSYSEARPQTKLLLMPQRDTSNHSSFSSYCSSGSSQYQIFWDQRGRCICLERCSWHLRWFSKWKELESDYRIRERRAVIMM